MNTAICTACGKRKCDFVKRPSACCKFVRTRQKNRPSVCEAAAAGVFSGALEMMETVNRVNAEAYRRNGERWAEDGSGNGSGGSGGSAGSGSGSSQTQEEAAQSLITWLEGRIANLDRLINERAGE